MMMSKVKETETSVVQFGFCVILKVGCDSASEIRYFSAIILFNYSSVQSHLFQADAVLAKDSFCNFLSHYNVNV